MKILFSKKGYKPFYYFIMGGGMELFSRRKGKVLKGTWDFWGFETIIWAKKLQ